MRLLFIGDIVGKPGRKMVGYHLPRIKKKYQIDFVVANYENASHGFGLTPKNYKELKSYGIDVFTGGNHTFDKKEIFELLKNNKDVLRPLNIYEEIEGRGIFIDEVKKLAIISLMGDFAMPRFNNPFRVIEKEIEKLQDYTIFIDFHAEATAEKRAMFLMIKDKISALVGTHTHIGTDDLTIDEETGYLTDIGLTGCFDDVIGMEAQEAIDRAKKGVFKRFEIAKECQKIFQAVVFEFDGKKCMDAFKIKAYNFEEEFISQKAIRL